MDTASAYLEISLEVQTCPDGSDVVCRIAMGTKRFERKTAGSYPKQSPAGRDPRREYIGSCTIPRISSAKLVQTI